MDISRRRYIENRIICRVVSSAHSAGFSLSVRDDEGWIVRLSTDHEEVVLAIYAADGPTVVMHGPTTSAWVTLLRGNGTDVICDYSDSARAVLAGARELAERLAR